MQCDKKNTPQGGPVNPVVGGESTPSSLTRLCGSPNVSGGGNPLHCGDAPALTAGPITSEGQSQKAGAVSETPPISARDKRGRFKRPNTTSSQAGESDADGGSDGSFVSLTSVGGRKRKAKPPSTSVVAAKFTAVPVAASGGESATGAETEEDLFDPFITPTNTRAKKNLPGPETLAREMRSHGDVELSRDIDFHLQVLEKVADRSRNLKGEYVRGIRLAVRNIKAAAEELARRTDSNDNVARLERENAELRSQLSSLSTKTERLTQEISLLRKQMQERSTLPTQLVPAASKPRSGKEELMADIGALIDRKLAAFHARLIPERTSANQQLTPREQLPASMRVGCPQSQPLTSLPQPKKKKKRRVKKKKEPSHLSVVDLPPVAAPPQLHNSSPPMVSSWADVARRPKYKRSTEVADLTPSPRGRKKRRKTEMRTPASAAVTVTLPKDSVLTYAKVMGEAKARIQLAELGIDSVRQKRAVTGGLLLEIAGQDCNSKADKLAAKLREVFCDLNVRISRPIKMSDIRLKDLDDAVSPCEIAAAIAELGGCSVDDIKVGDVRRTPTSMGTCWMRCPVTAVRKLITEGRVRIGWGSTRVELLESRPMHCYRCLEKGHVGSKCPNEVDRSTRCYACGEPGHRANQCTASVLKCPVCSDLGRPSNHRLGKQCAQPAKRGVRKSKHPPTPSSETGTAVPAAAPSSGSAMEVAET
ncbi:unnamed protein product [Parnassius mnemosyne]|uniref:CCHC-type domain-containing protein n=1 Tax=Parnassius mnemosyne TaxID=213953 RepID=A0AAV1LSL1_9NEOP